jgi:cysteinyl-tRNA synthetase
MERAKQNVEKIAQFFFHLQHIENSQNLTFFSKDVTTLIENTKKTFKEQMSDDFNTSEALTALFAFIKSIYALKELTKTDAQSINAFLEETLSVLGFSVEKANTSVDDSVQKQLDKRDELKEMAKKERNKEKKQELFQQADEIRSELLSQGILIEDTPQGTRWRKQ